MTHSSPDFQLLFEESPDLLLVLLPDSPRFTQVAASRARLTATQVTKEQTIGHGILELFPDNPDDPAATGARNLRASLERVLATRAADTMAVQKYDIRRPDGTFEARHWSVKNIPVLSADGEVIYIFHSAVDVTELIRASEMGEELRGRTHDMEREVLMRSQELAAANTDLRDANARLGQLDAAKTAFFSNVSHEFRTPLTLMLGPLEDALADSAVPLAVEQKTRLALAHDNALRLLKLVNALLEFSRIEAGRVQASYAPVDLAVVTAELAGMFQSATTSAGVRLLIDCPPLAELAWIDRDMWEKIVPNLVSNAFKFTLAGEIVVRVRADFEQFVLEVSDTGVGIPDAELPKIFDRFHRVPGQKGRTHEGSGIGLSLVRELVELHGGRVGVTSAVGRGTTFRVEIPKGFAHLPAEAVSQQRSEVQVGRDAMAHAVEAARWARGANDAPAPATSSTPSPSPVESERPRERVLVVDDNADLREYVAALLAPTYDVTTAADGAIALAAARASPPDIVVSDVMMPNLDGLGLVRELRADERTASLPVILLSARAGEESAVEGLGSGSDDYLAKPFSARELLARVRTHVTLARMRRAWSAELERANRELEAFSYSVSHDLRAPLRRIRGFSQILAKDYGAALDAEGRSHLDHIDKGAEEMSMLIDGLLEMGRATRGNLSFDTVDLSELAANAIGHLKKSDPNRAVTVDITAGLTARGDRRLLGVVVVNLLGNAWKFSAKAGAARIEFGRYPAEIPTFFVHDNGAGFDMKYASQLFAPFQRLHHASEFEGTGVGLATVQRALARHGGRIWAEAAIGKGATFFFTLPDTHPGTAR